MNKWYGGTKTEMERLLADAQALTGVKYDIDNLADVYSAIHAIQEELEIAGTTAKEAEKTISGSAATMKAAWKNVLTAISGGGDLDRAIENLVDSISNLFENIVPVVEKSLQGIGRLIERVAPQLVQKVAKSLIEAIPSLLNAVYEMIIGLAKGIYQGVMALFYGEATESTKEQADAIEGATSNQKELTEAIKETNKELKGSLAGFDELNTLTKPEETDLNFGEIGTTGNKVQLDVEVETEIKEPSNFSSILKKVADKIKTIFKPVTDSLANLFEPLKENALSVWEELKSFKDWIVDEFAPAFASNLANSIDTVKKSFDTLKDSASNLWENVLKPIISDLGDLVERVMAKTDEFLQDFQKKLEEHKDSIDSVLTFLGGVISLLWKIIKPLFDFLVDQTFSSFGNVTDGIFSIIEIFGNLFDFIAEIVKGVVDLCKGNFDEAGEHFKNAGKAFVNIFIGIFNLIISGLNELWSLIFNGFREGVNLIGGIVEEVGSWIGADWGWHWDDEAPLIPEIPYLAQGAVIPPNNKFLAVLGDQTHGTNVEAPLATIKQALIEAMGEFGGNGNNQPIIIEIDGREVFRAVRNAESRYGSQTIIGGVANAY